MNSIVIVSGGQQGAPLHLYMYPLSPNSPLIQAAA